MNYLSSKRSLEKGSAMIVLILFTALASMVIVSMQGMVDSNRDMASKHALDAEYKELLIDIKHAVGNDTFCSTAGSGFMGLRLNSGTDLSSLAAPASINLSVPGASQPNIGPGWQNSNRRLRFLSFAWEFVSIENDGGASNLDLYVRASSPVRSRKALYRLIVNMKYCKTQACDDSNSKYFTNKRRDTGATTNFIVRDGGINYNAVDIPIYMHLSANTAFNVVSGAQVVSCFAENSGGDFCEKLGNIWNPLASTPRFRCEPRVNCRYIDARSNGTCAAASDTEILSRFVPLLEGMGVLNSDGTVAAGVPNISNCSWCNPYY